MSLEEILKRKKEALEEALKEEQKDGTLSPFLKVNDMGEVVDEFGSVVNTLTDYRQATERKVKNQQDGNNFLYGM